MVNVLSHVQPVKSLSVASILIRNGKFEKVFFFLSGCKVVMTPRAIRLHVSSFTNTIRERTDSGTNAYLLVIFESKCSFIVVF